MTLTPTGRDWHYPRNALASRILFSLQFAGREPARIVAEASSGKTTFLIRDLIPAAERQGGGSPILPVYIGLGTDRGHPTQVILDALQMALHRVQAPKSNAAASLKTPVKKIGALGFDIELGESPSRTPPPSGTPFLMIDQLVTELAERSGKTVLLVIDDAHHLLNADDSGVLCTAMRAMLSGRSRNVLALFATDSRSAAKQLFLRAGAPLFQFGRTIAFPPLGPEFVDHILKLYGEETGIDLERESLHQAFKTLKGSARLFMNMISDMALDCARDHGPYLEAALSDLAQERDWLHSHERLSPLEQLIVERAATDKPVSGVAAAVEYAARMNRNQILAKSISRALETLYDADVLKPNPQKEFQPHFVEPEYRDWLNERQRPRAATLEHLHPKPAPPAFEAPR